MADWTTAWTAFSIVSSSLRSFTLAIGRYTALRKAVKSIAALVETSSEENKATVLALCATLDDD